MKLKELLKDTLSGKELNLLVRGYDLVGDIAITIIPPPLSHRQRLIGEAILASNKRIKVVAKRDGVYQGEFRTIPLTIIAGEQRKETVHSEFGLRLLLSPEKVYFSVRSGTERKRIADLVRPNEEVLVMFSGIAPYPLMIAKYSNADSITGVESNRLAHDYGLRNIKINKAQKKITLFCGNVADVVPRFSGRFHRIVMPLPSGGLKFVPLALASLLPLGTLHFYDFQPPDHSDASLDSIREMCLTAGREMKYAEHVLCGHTSPRINRICLDIIIK